MFKTLVLLLMTGLVFGAEQGPITPKELEARMPADLGPDQIDVSGYPLAQQQNYAVFMDRCARCHTPARAINSQIVSHEDWRHFVALMHGRLLSRSMTPLWNIQEGDRIVDFLGYDSGIRKVAHPEDFASLHNRLILRFQAVQEEKARRAKNQPTKPSAPFTGANP